MVLMLPDGAGLGRRHYSVRKFDRDARRLDIDVVVHGDSSPGTRWALAAKPGDGVLAFGPRGRNMIQPGADWRLFVGDETGLPPIFAMLEALPAGAKARAIIEVASDDERQVFSGPADVAIDWVSRGGAAAQASSPALIEQVAAYALPAGRGHVYLLGETSTIRRLRHDLLARGIGKDQIFGEGYWRPGRLGGHDHLEEH
jgi:NADPH-dependent ferric siderophore reductase